MHIPFELCFLMIFRLFFSLTYANHYFVLKVYSRHYISDYGGIYLDWDVLVLKSFDDLRKYDVTLGRETNFSLANGIIMAKRGAAFLRIWLETYHSFREDEWGEHSCVMPNKLLSVVPHLVHVEETSLLRPNWKETDLLFSGHYPWRKNYAIHVWKRRGKVPQNPTDLINLNSTLGEIMRHVLFLN